MPVIDQSFGARQDKGGAPGERYQIAFSVPDGAENKAAAARVSIRAGNHHNIRAIWESLRRQIKRQPHRQVAVPNKIETEMRVGLGLKGIL